jgi:hypothetical protein
MEKINIVISWDSIMSESQFAQACTDTIRHGIISDDPSLWKGSVCSPFLNTKSDFENEKWRFDSYGYSSESFGWIEALKNCTSEWILLTYPGVAVHVDSLISRVERYYDYNDPVCLCASLNYDLDKEICDIISGGEETSSDVQKVVPHEWGSIIMSRAAAFRIVQNKESMEFLASRSGSPLRFDHISTIPRVAAKIPIQEFKAMNPGRSTDSFKGTNRLGEYSLMHYVGDWMDEKGWHDYLRARLFASSLDGLKDGEFGSDLSMPDIKSDVILVLSQPGNLDRIKWLQKSCQQHIRPVPSIVVLLKEDYGGKYSGKSYESIVEFCASTRTGIIRMRQDKSWDENSLLIKGCMHLLNKKAKRIFASIGDCYMLSDPFKTMNSDNSLIFYNEDGSPSTSAFGVSCSAAQMEEYYASYVMWNNHSLAVKNSSITSFFDEKTKIIRKDPLFWRSVSRENIIKMGREGEIVAATGESACRALLRN